MHLVDCANCGQQVEIEGPEDTCYWCGKNASKKEIIMAETEERAVPPKPKKRRKHWEYFDQNQEAIVADYRSMKLVDFFKRWAITSSSWTKLKKKWGVENKGRGLLKPAKRPKQGNKPKGANTQELTEHERYLILLGYQQATREFLRADKNLA